MKGTILHQSIFISLLGHLTVFSLFSFSFSQKLPYLGQNSINFRGAILSNSDLAAALYGGALPASFQKDKVKPDNFFGRVNFIFNKTNTRVLERINRDHTFLPRNSLKPSVALSLNETKLIYSEKTPLLARQLQNKPVVMFYPPLPHYFSLYFKDRQAVHIELVFNIMPNGLRNSIEVKRKVSSGNLEADLLSIRYISQYLFIRQKEFTLNKWQTVNIDLSAKN